MYSKYSYSRHYIVQHFHWHLIFLHLYGGSTVPTYGKYFAFYKCTASIENEDCKITYSQGGAMSKALHTPSNYRDQNYQRFIRIFSLHMKEQPIQITMKQMFTFNYALLKSVGLHNENSQ